MLKRPYTKSFFFKLSKKLRYGFSNISGRNNLGRVCVKGRGGANKRLISKIDYFRRVNCFGILIKIFYDANRSSKIGFVIYDNGLISFVLLSNNLYISDNLFSGFHSNFFPRTKSIGSAVPLNSLPLLTLINNIELMPFKGSKLARSAGISAVMLSNSMGKGFQIKMSSGWILTLSKKCLATIGIVSNTDNIRNFYEKAGKKRAAGFRPKVRGVAKNPCDHPHGGGNGKKSKPVVPLTAWGKLAKWTPTLNKQIHRSKRFLYKTKC